ncbi:hypothetical protein Q31b_25700 [Novipirellula aureliae]|uniref:Uncharacterized protein n=1 Tax=Novipirellula aureliae TaxID=2527966 RepID=A0A5C6E8I5_9BACT|nr:hypothetical protein Q31b_25700 [Novipirellula aureliae]
MDLRSIIAKSKRTPKVSAIFIEHGSQQDVSDLSPSRFNGFPETSERPAPGYTYPPKFNP